MAVTAVRSMLKPDAKMRLTKLTKEQAIKEWPMYHTLLSQSDVYSLGRYSMADMLKDVKDGNVFIVIAWMPAEHRLFAVFAIQVELYPQMKVFNVVGCGGVELEKWVGLYPAMRHMAKELGCSQVQITGRPGWSRVLRPYLREAGRIFVEEL